MGIIRNESGRTLACPESFRNFLAALGIAVRNDKAESLLILR